MKDICIFLDRDGVINRERSDYTFKIEDFEILKGVKTALGKIKDKGYKIIVITNQSGISQGLYTREDTDRCHEYMVSELDSMIDQIYYSPYHPKISESLSRKPDSLLFEKAIARYNIDVSKSWMLGDRERDLIPARKLGIKTILVDNFDESEYADHYALDLLEAVNDIILKPQEEVPERTEN